MFGTIINYVSSLKNGEEAHDFCADETIFFLKKAEESHEAMKNNADEWHQQARVDAEVMLKTLPFLIANQLIQSQVSDTQESAESSPDTQVGDQ